MSRRPPRDLRELLGADVPEKEVAELAQVDALLRSVPPPPAELPDSLDRAVKSIPRPRPVWTRTRLALAAALALTLAGLFFGVGRWTGGGFDSSATIEMRPAESAPQASAIIQLGERDEATGNWKLRLVVDGLPELGGDGYYVLWLAKDGEYAATCGTFNAHGRTTVDLTASYRLDEYDAWVISEARDDAPWLLSAKT